MSQHVTLIPGDGIGSEVIEAARAVVDALALGIKWEYADAGLSALNKQGSALPERSLQSIRETRVALKGPTTTPIGTGHKSANVILRQALDLYASIRPVKSLPGIHTRYDNVDLIVVRENTEGLYKGLENEITKGCVVSLKVVTEAASRRIAHKAFTLAQGQGRKSVTTVHKANILKLGDGLFLSSAYAAAAQYPAVEAKDVIVDAVCMKLVSNPNQFDVLLMENLYGDIISDLCAGLVGGLGVVPGANIGDKEAVFEAVHGSAPDIAGKGLANPIAMILSAAMMLRHLGLEAQAGQIEKAVEKTLVLSKARTPDLGGTSTTREFTAAIIAQL